MARVENWEGAVGSVLGALIRAYGTGKHEEALRRLIEQRRQTLGGYQTMPGSFQQGFQGPAGTGQMGVPAPYTPPTVPQGPQLPPQSSFWQRVLAPGSAISPLLLQAQLQEQQIAEQQRRAEAQQTLQAQLAKEMIMQQMKGGQQQALAAFRAQKERELAEYNKMTLGAVDPSLTGLRGAQAQEAMAQARAAERFGTMYEALMKQQGLMGGGAGAAAPPGVTPPTGGVAPPPAGGVTEPAGPAIPRMSYEMRPGTLTPSGGSIVMEPTVESQLALEAAKTRQKAALKPLSEKTIEKVSSGLSTETLLKEIIANVKAQPSMLGVENTATLGLRKQLKFASTREANTKKLVARLQLVLTRALADARSSDMDLLTSIQSIGTMSEREPYFTSGLKNLYRLTKEEIQRQLLLQGKPASEAQTLLDAALKEEIDDEDSLRERLKKKLRERKK